MENNNEYTDITLVCKDCGSEFVFTAGFENQPVRCPACRKARKQQRFNNN